MRRALILSLAALIGCATAPPRRPARGADEQLSRLVHEAAQRHRVRASLVLGVITVESGFDREARSHVGARGLMQLMPKTAASLARRLGYSDYSLTDPRFNVDAGTYYLAYLLRLFDHDEALALAAYNTGPARVKRWQRDRRPLPAYSRRYVAAVKRSERRFVDAPTAPLPHPQAEGHDRDGLRRLLRRQLYGDRDDEPLATRLPAARPMGAAPRLN